MLNRRLAMIVALLGLAAAAGCGNQNFACVGFCVTDTTQYFEGYLSAGSLHDARAACAEQLACPLHQPPDCTCYQTQ